MSKKMNNIEPRAIPAIWSDERRELGNGTTGGVDEVVRGAREVVVVSTVANEAGEVVPEAGGSPLTDPLCTGMVDDITPCCVVLWDAGDPGVLAAG